MIPTNQAEEDTTLNVPNINNLFQFASTLIGNNENSDVPSPFSFLNSPEFSQTVESMTRGLLSTLTQGSTTSNRRKRNRMVKKDAEEEEECDKKNRTKDLVLELPVSLEDMYRGKNKKITVKRKRSYEQSDGTYKIVEERHQLVVEIERGARNDTKIVFPNKADELPGFEKGDVVVILKEQEHSLYIRCFDDLMINRNISISELFYFDTVLKLLDGSFVRIQNSENDLLSDLGYIRKIIGKGMPVPSDPTKYGDLFIQFNVVPNCEVIPSKQELRNIFPPLNELPEDCNENESIELEKLEDDDYYKLDLFEEDECSESNEDSSDEESESELDETQVNTSIKEGEEEEEDDDEDENEEEEEEEDDDEDEEDDDDDDEELTEQQRDNYVEEDNDEEFKEEIQPEDIIVFKSSKKGSKIREVLDLDTC